MAGVNIEKNEKGRGWRFAVAELWSEETGEGAGERTERFMLGYL